VAWGGDMFTKEKRKFILKAMGIAMFFASSFSWWQTGIERQLTGYVFWRNFLVLEVIFAALICFVTTVLLLAHYLDQDF
jgi:hypothetical protein